MDEDRESGGRSLKRLTNGWDRGDDLSQLEFVKDGGLSGSVKTNHEDTWSEKTVECAYGSQVDGK